MKLVLTCEHAFNKVPEEYQYLFLNAHKILESHQGYDPGALDLFKELKVLADFSKVQQIGRLLVEVNRSKGHARLFSEFTGKLSKAEKTKILNKYYFPYRNALEKAVATFIEKGEQVLHCSVHTFTPELNKIIRKTDMGLLYDPAISSEKEFSKRFKRKLKLENPDLKVRFNYPYLGKADGFTTYLRKKFPENYMGIELEINQKFVISNRMNVGLIKQIFSALESLKD